MYQTLLESASFCKRYGKYILVCFLFIVLNTVYLQKVNAKFHKVEWRHYSNEAENVYISYDKFTQDNMCQILSQFVRLL